ncbi:phosphopantetheine-binding protein, partial [Pseudomonas syringae group genomosp. 7]|uniref:phosphopantetheine-binding protein n=1 Tax=Pseudomonas syringae group genomosp. 7 TaxID=251699 RepID=UPI00376FB568
QADGSLASYAGFPATSTASQIDGPDAGSALQAQIDSIWCEQLRCENISADAHFFLLGGNSIVSTGVVSRLPETLRIDLNLRILLEA